jgi:hypothetical protein
MKPSFVFAVLSTVAIAQAFGERDDLLTIDGGSLNLERGLTIELRSGLFKAPMLENVAVVYKYNSISDTNNTGVLVSSTCANVLLYGTDLFMGAAFVAAILPVLLEMLGFAGNVHIVSCKMFRF